MAKAKENIRKKQVDFLVFLKSISKWITNKKRQDDQLEYLIDKFKIENSIVKRILSYNYGFPHIIQYFNRYFNNLYDFDTFDTKLLIKSLVYVMDINNRSDSRCFTYIKSNELKDEIKNTIKELIKEYLNITYDIACNKRELNFYYKLFKIGYITDEDLLTIDRHLNGENTKIKSLESINFSSAINISSDIAGNEEINTELSSNMIEYINTEFKQKKALRKKCQECELFRKAMVVLDTNCEDFGNIDIMLIGLNPSKEEADQDKLWVGETGKEIRKIINKLNGKKWLTTNTILCSTGSKKDITNIDLVKENCYDFTGDIFKRFKSSHYIPIGEEACKMFNIEDKITTCSGKSYDLDNGSKIIPLIHPSAVLKSRNKYQSIFDVSVRNILANFNISEGGAARATGSTTAEIKIDNNKMVSDTKDLLLVDVKKLENNKILMIYTDLAGNKKYELKDFKIPVYIKNKIWSECSMVTDKVDEVCLLNDYEKSKLSQKCFGMIKEMV